MLLLFLPRWGLKGALVVGLVLVILELVVLAALVPAGPRNGPAPLHHALGPDPVQPFRGPAC